MKRELDFVEDDRGPEWMGTPGGYPLDTCWNCGVRALPDERQVGLRAALDALDGALDADHPEGHGCDVCRAADDLRGLIEGTSLDPRWRAAIDHGASRHEPGPDGACRCGCPLAAQVPAQEERLREAADALVRAWRQPMSDYWLLHQDAMTALTLHIGPRVDALYRALTPEPSQPGEPETWRDADLIEAVKTGKQLGSMARQRLLELLDRGPDHAP